MSTLADQFHDSFEPYYAGRKQSWLERKAAQQPAGQMAPDREKPGAEVQKPTEEERRH